VRRYPDSRSGPLSEAPMRHWAPDGSPIRHGSQISKADPSLEPAERAQGTRECDKQCLEHGLLCWNWTKADPNAGAGYAGTNVG
jgi:hypothetical protein